MSPYKRYFRITDGPVMDAVLKHMEASAQAAQKVREILKEAGGTGEFYHIDGTVTAIEFATPPDATQYRKVANGWYPRKNTRFGKALHKRISAAKLGSLNACLMMSGLDHRRPLLVAHGKGHYATTTLIPWDAPTLLVVVPWYDEDPDKLEEYRTLGIGGNFHFDHLLWKPLDSMVEIKQWQALEEIDRWNKLVDSGEEKT